jgi:hypothetical protein
MIFDTLVSFDHLTWLMAQEDFVKIRNRKSFKSYNINIEYCSVQFHSLLISIDLAKAQLKAMVMKNLLISDHSEY